MRVQIDANRIIEKAHPWVSTILHAIFASTLGEILRQVFGTRKLAKWLTPKSLKRKLGMSSIYARDLVAKYAFWNWDKNRTNKLYVGALQARLIARTSGTTSTRARNQRTYLCKAFVCRPKYSCRSPIYLPTNCVLTERQRCRLRNHCYITLQYYFFPS